MKKAVIIGAGQTGRGFIAPILQENGYELVFLDKDQELAEQLKREGRYEVRYFGNQKEARTVSGFRVFSMEEPEAVWETAEADVVFVSVFASHIPELTEHFKAAAAKRREGRLTILCCENGVDVKRPLVESGLEAVISEGIIFCTTLRPRPDSLDLISQDYPELPVDGSVEGLNIHIEGIPLEMNFPALIQRKIYTYNFISAIVAYLGSYKGYEVYGDAANDEEIARVIADTVPVISRVIGRKYQVPYEVQEEFTNRAVSKFRNREIYDTIYRNARQAERKLGREERLLTPLRLAWEYREDTRNMELVTAAAVFYGIHCEGMKAEAVLAEIKELLDERTARRIAGILEGLEGGQSLSKLSADSFF